MAGLVFGLSLGIVNNYLLYRNVLVTTNHVHSVEDMPLRPKLDISSWRLFLVIIGFLLAYRLEGIQLLTVIIGFFYCQGLAHFYMMFDAIQESRNLE